MADLYTVDLVLQNVGGDQYIAITTDTVDTTGMAIESMTVEGGTRHIVLRHVPVGGDNPFTVGPYNRQSGEESVNVLVQDAAGQDKGEGNRDYE